MTAFDAGAEFDRQADVLRQLGYPALAGMSDGAFTAVLAPLRDRAISGSASAASPTPARVPFAIAVSAALVPANEAVRRTEIGGRPGHSVFEPDDIARFTAIDELDVPAEDAYLVFDIDRGTESLNVSPDDAMPGIRAAGRTPLTVAEGIAFLTLFPQSLEKNHCYMMAGARCGDRRVPALWISKKAPKLGWCWAGNRHTWLGIASCGARSENSVAAVPSNV